eukprot:15478125-Alexandrium_andersonii.AAC.1
MPSFLWCDFGHAAMQRFLTPFTHACVRQLRARRAVAQGVVGLQRPSRRRADWASATSSGGARACI